MTTTNENVATGSAPATAAVQQFLESCPAVLVIRERGERFEFDYDTTIEVSFVPESLHIEW